MHLIKAEFQRNLYTYANNKKTTLLSLLIFILIISITLNVYEKRFSEIAEISAVIIGTMYLIRLSLSCLVYPTSQIIENIKKDNIDTSTSMNSYHLETVLLVRSIIALFFNAIIATFFVILLDFFNPRFINENLVTYGMIISISIMGSIGIIGLGFIILSIIWRFSVNMPVILLSQILLILLIFSTPIDNPLIPFSDTKLFIINIFNGYSPNATHYLEYFLRILLSSSFYLLIGYLTLRFTRVNIISKQMKEWGK